MRKTVTIIILALGSILPLAAQNNPYSIDDECYKYFQEAELLVGKDGFEVLRQLRSNPETADLRVVILSALNSNEDIVKGFNAGANDFIMKPIIMEKLLTCVITQIQLVANAEK